MPLKFECNQDIKKMKAAHGKKFCEACRKHVYDVRKKSDEKIIDLRKQGECVIIYADQLKKVEDAERALLAKEKSNPSLLPYAAGIAAISFATGMMTAQSCPPNNGVHTVQRDDSGHFLKQIPKTNAKEILFTYKGHLKHKKIKDIDSLPVTLTVTDPNDSNATQFAVVTFEPDKNGNFSFSLTKDMVDFLKGKDLYFSTDYYDISIERFMLQKPEKKIELKLNRRMFRGF